MHLDGEWPPDDGPGDGRDGDSPPSQGVDTTVRPDLDPPPQVRLRREYKGPTVRDLVADRGLDEQLPGRVRSALEHLQRGDLAAAEAALPGHFGAVLEGPARRQRRRRRQLVRWITVAVLASAAATATIWLL
jgi:hypothetical protein